MLYVGHGAVIAGAGPAIMKLAETLKAPIVNTLLGKGACPGGPCVAPGDAGDARHRLRQQDGHELRHDHGDRRPLGRPESPASLSEFCVGATKIHVDIDVAEFNKIVRPDVSLAVTPS